jgi:hypothetical protein
VSHLLSFLLPYLPSLILSPVSYLRSCLLPPILSLTSYPVSYLLSCLLPPILSLISYPVFHLSCFLSMHAFVCQQRSLLSLLPLSPILSWVYYKSPTRLIPAFFSTSPLSLYCTVYCLLCEAFLPLFLPLSPPSHHSYYLAWYGGLSSLLRWRSQ